MKLCIEISDKAFEEMARMIAEELARTILGETTRMIADELAPALANSTVDAPGAYGVNREEKRLAEQISTSPAETEEAEDRQEKDPPAAKEDAVSAPSTREAVVSALVSLGKAEGRDAVVGILSRYGCTTVSMLQSEQYGPIIEEARKARG